MNSLFNERGFIHRFITGVGPLVHCSDQAPCPLDGQQSTINHPNQLKQQYCCCFAGSGCLIPYCWPSSLSGVTAVGGTTYCELVGNAEPFFLWRELKKKQPRERPNHIKQELTNADLNPSNNHHEGYKFIHVCSVLGLVTTINQRTVSVELFSNHHTNNHTWFCLNYSSCSVAPQRVIPFMHNKILWCFIYFHNQVIQCIIGEFLSSSNSNSAEHAVIPFFQKFESQSFRPAVKSSSHFV